MRTTPTISAALAVLLPLLASCAAPGTGGESAFSSKLQIGLTNATETVRLFAPAEYIGPIQLQVFDDTLIDPAFPQSSTSTAPWLRVGDRHFLTLNATQPAPAATSRGNEWQYLRIDSATPPGGVLNSMRRHMLMVEPDLVVILDELLLTNSTSVEIQLPSLRPFQHDIQRDEWTLDSEHAGLVTRFLSSPKSAQCWVVPDASSTHCGETNTFAGSVSSVVAESGSEYFHLAIFVAHPKPSRQSLGFKLLESDTAIGARIHRDGLPTLVAFRKATCVGEANLTGLIFTTPVAVDVFHPKPRK